MNHGEPEASEKPVIEPLKNGPLRISHLDRLIDADGRELPTGSGVLLCRCGHSLNKPYCDGTHARIGYRSHKLDGRLPDRCRDWVGTEITIHDNRGVCSHAEHCVRELPTVFNRADRPWIHPDAEPADSIARTIEKCPSGALSYTRDGVLHKDQDREPAVRIDRDGPYEVVGGCELADPDGCRPESREHYTLCRCGKSKNKPFCDGAHWNVALDLPQEVQ
ncbi:MAG: CDGSH iron-sulfur domain-containing protein [Dehalococcoidia bacterium]|nr:CDGSH iron-sulfur domain-containing protein [Dehalococcoidia bacterium]